MELDDCSSKLHDVSRERTAVSRDLGLNGQHSSKSGAAILRPSSAMLGTYAQGLKHIHHLDCNSCRQPLPSRISSLSEAPLYISKAFFTAAMADDGFDLRSPIYLAPNSISFHVAVMTELLPFKVRRTRGCHGEGKRKKTPVPTKFFSSPLFFPFKLCIAK